MWLQEATLHPDLLDFLQDDESHSIIEQLQGKSTAAPKSPVSAAVKGLATAVASLRCNNNVFSIGSFDFDLISAVNRQLKFAAKMTCLAWRHSPFLHATLTSAITRYQRFFLMMKEHSQLAPTLDIDLVWHTHQLMPSAYWEYSHEVVGRFVNHNDMISKDTAGLSLRNAVVVYEESFKESYSLCFCWSCEASRHSVRPVEETAQIVENALNAEIARGLKTGSLAIIAFAMAHGSKRACHPIMECVRALLPVRNACSKCNEEHGCLKSTKLKANGEDCSTEDCSAGPCNGQPWCDPDCDGGGCDGD